MDGAQAEIERRMADCTITVRASDFLDLPPLIENVIEVDLPPTAARHYRELQKEMFTVLAGGHEVEAFNAAAKTMKCLQAANGGTIEVAATDPMSRQTGLALGLYEREVRFYSEVAPRLGGPIAQCFHTSYDPETGIFALLIDDAAPAVVGDDDDDEVLADFHLVAAQLPGQPGGAGAGSGIGTVVGGPSGMVIPGATTMLGWITLPGTGGGGVASVGGGGGVDGAGGGT